MRFQRNILTKRTALGLAGMAMIWTATTAQAQLYIHIYPSQDNDNQTIWIFSHTGSGDRVHGVAATRGSSIRSSQNFHIRDSWQLDTPFDFYIDNKPTNQFFSLSPLFSSTNTIDIESVQKRMPGGVFGGGFFPHATNAPTIAISNTSRTIGSIFMNDTASFDEIGIRNTPPNLVFTTNDFFRWFGAGIMDKPIGDFRQDRDTFLLNRQGAPYFMRQGGIGITVHSQVIPEPAECAIIFSIFALVFIIVHRYFQKRGERIS